MDCIGGHQFLDIGFGHLLAGLEFCCVVLLGVVQEDQVAVEEERVGVHSFGFCQAEGAFYGGAWPVDAVELLPKAFRDGDEVVACLHLLLYYCVEILVLLQFLGYLKV